MITVPAQNQYRKTSAGGSWTGLGCECFRWQVTYTPLCSFLRLSLLKQSTQLSCCSHAQNWKVTRKEVPVEDLTVSETAELFRHDVSGTQSIMSVLALWMLTCICLVELLDYRVSMYQTLDWTFKCRRLNTKKYLTSLKKKITTFPKNVWCLPWVRVLQPCTFPVPVSDNEQQNFWGVFAFWSPLWSNAIVHWQKRCEVQNKVMKLIWFPSPNPSIYMPLLY